MGSAPRAVPPSVNAWSAEYLDAQYEVYLQDPESIPADLRSFFQGFDLAMSQGGQAPSHTPVEGSTVSRLQHAVDDLISSYRSHGHLAAKIDPFGREPDRPVDLTLDYHNLSEADLDKQVNTGSLNLPEDANVRSIIDKLEDTYCNSVGVELMYLSNTDERDWLIEVFEEHNGRVVLDKGQRVHILGQLVHSEVFEKFLGRRYPSEKRFSLEGSESLIPLLDQLIEHSTDLGVEEIILGMAHRGRLNVLNNILGKTHEQIFTEFEDNWGDDFADGGGDVKYHRGYSGTRQFGNGKQIHLAMSSNPSHLEAVDGVVQGRCRSKQRLRGDKERGRVIPVLIHGDAAMAGQGLVAEVLNLSQLQGYKAGGTVHIVVNNMIGFTTSPEDARSSRYCTDVAKMIDAPVFHVNGDDPEAVVAVSKFAIEYRQKFKRDVVIDLYCFRRYGHNEQDEPSFTQPILAGLIKEKRSVLDGYAERLLAEGVINQDDIETIHKRLGEALESAQRAAQESPYDPTIDPGSARWKGLGRFYSHEPVDTAVSPETLAEVCRALGSSPDGFSVNRKLQRILKARAQLMETRQISYAEAEALAYGTLLLEGTSVRLSGQDCRRGTFSHRHAVLRDAKSGEPYTSLNHMRELGAPGSDHEPGSIGEDGRPRQAKLCVYDSPLSEQSVLGFEYGYSLADPDMLVLWEAQFGDFANGAQVIIDQFLASAELKWERWSGIVLLLPHGYEGAGPEHSSARIERFLQLCGNDNMQVVYPSTAAQVFHMHRRQMHRPFRKPLIVMTPKSMLRVPTSTIDELINGRFHEIIDDLAFAEAGQTDRDKVKRLVFCTGKVFHDLVKRRDELAKQDVAIIRVEQLYPFHTTMMRQIIGQYPESAELVWAQEEPRNMGAYQFIAEVFKEQLGFGNLEYIGREASASPAVGSASVHKVQQESIVTRAVGPKPAESDQTKKATPPEQAGGGRRIAASA